MLIKERQLGNIKFPPHAIGMNLIRVSNARKHVALGRSNLFLSINFGLNV